MLSFPSWKEFCKSSLDREMGGYVTEMGGQEEMWVAKLEACGAGTLQDWTDLSSE